MTMLEERPTKLIPLPDAIKALDSDESVLDRKRRAKQMALKIVGDERNAMIATASRDDLQRACEPIYRAANRENWHDSNQARPMPEAEKEAGRNIDALMPRLCEEHLRRTDEAALYRDPARLCQQRVWGSYTTQVSAVAWSQGNKSDTWIARWSSMVAERADLEEFGEPTASVDRRLLHHVGVPFPQMPEAAWEAADMLPATERQAEYDRLSAEWGPREPATTPATDTPKRRGRR